MSDEKKVVPEKSAKNGETKPQKDVSTSEGTQRMAQQRRPPPQQQQQQQRNPAKVGKANPARDIPIFLGLVGFLFLVAYSFSGIGGTKEKEKKKSIRQMQDDLRKQFEVVQAREKAKKRTMECELFLAHSSVPGAGLGVFAGKRFEVGDAVIHPGISYPIELDSKSQHDDADASRELLVVSQYGFILKHHPYLANVEGDVTWIETGTSASSTASVLRATSVIEPGDELFLSLDQHPQSRASDLFSLPILEDYELAEQIINDEIRVQRRGTPARSFGGRTGGAVGSVLMLVKRSVAIFNKRVALLLPGSPKGLETRDLLGSHTVFAALTNRTVSYLEGNGQCLDDVEVKSIGSNSSEVGLFARRLVKKGNVIVPVPLFAQRVEGTCLANAESCTPTSIGQSVSKYCYGHKESSLALCPLSSAVYIRTSSANKKESGPANAALKWSSRVNVKNVQKLTVDDIVKNHNLSLSFDLIALRTIQPGEEILIDERKESITTGGSVVKIEDSIYSETWKDYKLTE